MSIGTAENHSKDFEPMNIRRDHVGRRTVDYTEPQPEVLYVLATPSGYFILGQYLSFPRARRGKRCSLFAQQILNHGHTSIRDYLGYGSIDHRFSITSYGRIEEGNLRNHRTRSFELIPEFIPTQLVVLGFILEHRGPEHLEPEHDKVNFCEQLGVSKEFLPGQVSEGGMRSRPTVRYFAYTSPLFLALRLPGSAPVVTLSYLDAGLETIASFLIILAPTSSAPASSLLFASFVYLQSTPSLRGQKDHSVRSLKNRLTLMGQRLLRFPGLRGKFESCRYALPGSRPSNS